jgi:hypothetical protein
VADRKFGSASRVRLDYVIAGVSQAIQILQIWIASSLALLAVTVCGELDCNDSRGIFAWPKAGK